MASSRVTLGAILGTVNETATMITSTVATLGKGVSMLDTFVTDAAHEQKIRSIANGEKVIENVIRESAMDEAIRNKEVLEFCKKSDDHAVFYQTAYDRYSALLRPVKGDTGKVYAMAAE